MNVFKKAMEENRIAKVRIGLDMLRNNTDVLQLLMSQVLVTDVTPFHAYNGLEYEMVHPMFEPVADRIHAPVIGLREIYVGTGLELLEFCDVSEIVRR